MKANFTLLTLFALLLANCGQAQHDQKMKTMNSDFPVNKTEEEWKQELTPQQYSVLREKGTDRPFTGEFDQHWDSGVYVCAACGNELFLSTAKFDAGCGWPSFYDALDPDKVIRKPDNSHGMRRTEILCARCGGHLGHVFDDGPKPTGDRYCVNSSSIGFKKK
jgi:peptide-methionine (R)-S-oxide reductase